MKSCFWVEKCKYLLFFNLEYKKKILRFTYFNRLLPWHLRFYAYFRLKLLSYSSSTSRIKRRCLLTNRSRSVYKLFGLSRLSFRRLALSGNLVGVKKASW